MNEPPLSRNYSNKARVTTTQPPGEPGELKAHTRTTRLLILPASEPTELNRELSATGWLLGSSIAHCKGELGGGRAPYLPHSPPAPQSVYIVGVLVIYPVGWRCISYVECVMFLPENLPPPPQSDNIAVLQPFPPRAPIESRI